VPSHDPNHYFHGGVHVRGVIVYVTDPNPPDETSHITSLLYTSVRGSVRVGPYLVGRIGSGVPVTASFQKKIPPGFVLRQQTGGYDVGEVCPGGSPPAIVRGVL